MLSVIICTYNREKYIYNVMQSVALNRFSTSDFEIVLVNNNSTDATEQECKRFQNDYPQVRFCYCFEPQQGLSYARNCGIQNASGDVLVYVDDDALVNDVYLQTYADFFSRCLDVDAAGGPIIPKYESDEPAWMSRYTRLLLTGMLYRGAKEQMFPNNAYPGGGNAAYRKSVFDKIGCFNVDLGRKGSGLMGSEEKDIFDKMRALGMKVAYLPQAVLYHLIPDFKLQKDYLIRLSLAVGRGERMRTLAISKKKYRKRCFAEMIKWVATLAYYLVFLFLGRKSAGDMLFAFRLNVTRGLLKDAPK